MTRPQNQGAEGGSGVDAGAFEFTTGAPVGTPVALQFVQQPSTTQAGMTMAPAVTVRVVDAGGTLVSSSASITLTLTGTGGGTLSGTTTQSATCGRHRHLCQPVRHPGEQRLYAHGAVERPDQCYECPVYHHRPPDARGRPLSRLATIPRPRRPWVWSSVRPCWSRSRDQFHAVVTTGPTSTLPVTLALQQNPAGGRSAGRWLRRTPWQAWSTFNRALTVTPAGAGYSFRASATLPGGVRTDQSDFFAITAGPPPTGPAAPSTLQSLSQTVNGTGTILMGWDYAQGTPAATGFTVEEQAACTGAWTARPGMPLALSPQTYTRSGLALGSTTCWRVVAVDATGGRSAPSNTLQWTVGGAPAATAVAFEVQPGPTEIQAVAFTPPVTVRVVDATFTTVSTSTAPVTIALQANPAGGTLSCGPLTCTRHAVAGVATFDGLSVNTVGTGYTLGATSAGLAADQSQFFTVLTASPPPPSDLTITLFSTGMFLGR